MDALSILKEHEDVVMKRFGVKNINFWLICQK